MATRTDSACYRITGIGEALIETLDEFLDAGVLSDESREAILGLFNTEMRKMLTKRNVSVRLLGDIKHYSHVNDNWVYRIRELKLTTQGRSLRTKGETTMVLPRKN